MPKSKSRKRKPPLAPARTGRCWGYQLDHHDGSMSCSRGEHCPGVALPHAGWRDCDVFEACAYCDGPPVTWFCEKAGGIIPPSIVIGVD